MTREMLRSFCRRLPHVIEDVKWGNNLCFLIGGKMFAVTCLERTAPVKLSFKCKPERFTELVEVDGIIPAPYMARNHWVSLERWDALRDAEIKDSVTESYALVKARLPKKVQGKLGDTRPARPKH
ncbi:MAG: MmcQ/YjbR family DNA-binding protein [Acidobacteriales bacterium]|nr:MmcQ/YjbR family DNA-binding protein [Terriglobales bacterium]